MTRSDTPMLHLLAPVDWQVLDDPPDGKQLERERFANIALLRTLHALDEKHLESGEEGEGGELLRLELKVDFMLQMLGRLLADSLQLPEAAEVAVSSQGICRTACPDGFPGQGRVRVSIYMEPLIHKPLVMYGVKPAHAGSGLDLAWEGLSEAEIHWLDRLVFRQHRREIARSKKP